jgi:tripartite-type tricarboxylate transporter receptor subunit TctC
MRRRSRSPSSLEIGLEETMRRFLARLLATALLSTACACALAQGSATPLRIIVPYAAGGSTDVIARVIGQKAGEILGQQVVVDNRPGGGTVIGTLALKAAPPDGNTIMLATPDFVVNAFIHSKLSYDPLKDFAPISVVAQNPLVMAAATSLQARNVADVLRLARAKPGTINFASAGIASTAHLSGELLQLLAGVKLNHVPYKGMGPAMVDLLAGRTQLTFVSWITIQQQVQDGKLVPLAVTSAKRLPGLANLPAIAETVPGFELMVWFGFLAPGGTPVETVNRLQQAFAQAVRAPEVRQQLATLAEIGAGTPKEFSELLLAEHAKWGPVVKAAHLQVE